MSVCVDRVCVDRWVWVDGGMVWCGCGCLGM